MILSTFMEIYAFAIAFFQMKVIIPTAMDLGGIYLQRYHWIRDFSLVPNHLLFTYGYLKSLQKVTIITKSIKLRSTFFIDLNKVSETAFNFS